MQEFEDMALEPYPVNGAAVPLLRLTVTDVPHVEIKVGKQNYRYERSFPIKGHSAVMPKHLLSHMDAGKHPLVVERPDRFYVYLLVEKAPAKAEASTES